MAALVIPGLINRPLSVILRSGGTSTSARVVRDGWLATMQNHNEIFRDWNSHGRQFPLQPHGIPVPPGRNMTTSGRFINPGITSRAKYDHISIVLSIPVDTGRVEAAGVALRHLPKKRFIFPDISIYRTNKAQIFIYIHCYSQQS